MKGFHLVVLLAAGPGVRDTQVIFLLDVFHLYTAIHSPYNSLYRDTLKEGAWICIINMGI